MSEFIVPIVRIGPGQITKHPNADTLSIVRIEVLGEDVIIRTGDFQAGDLAVYIPVDAVVPETVSGTEFLGEHRRIKAKRLRGIYSEGLLLPMSAIPAGRYVELGEDVGPLLGIKKHEDRVPDTWGTSVSGPSLPPRAGLVGRFAHWAFSDRKQLHVKDPGCIPVYDIEPYKRHSRLMVPGERVVISEKVHGSNFRACFMDGQLYVGSRNNFWRDMDGRVKPAREKFGEWVWEHILRRSERTDNHSRNLYWKIARQEGLEEKFRKFPNLAFYGEIYGQVQDLRYDAQPGQVWLRIFDIYNTRAGEWLDWDSVRCLASACDLQTVPVLYDGPFDGEILSSLVEGKSAIASNIREGVVVKPAVTRVERHFGRVILKWVSQAYKLRKGGSELQ